METLTMFPEEIRALVVDNDPRFLRSCSHVLPLLNYKVTTCKMSAPAALTLLLGPKPKNIDVLLIEAEKAATCGFDFRGIVEPYLSIPVIYYYHENTGDKVNMIRSRLQSGTYTIRRPLNIADVRNLWRVISWRKCCIVNNPNPNLQAGHNPIPLFPSTAVLGFDGRGLKGKNNDDPGSSSSGSGGAGEHSAMGQQQMSVIQSQQKVINWFASQQQLAAPQERFGMEARNNNGKASMSQQAQAMEARQKLRQTVMRSVLHALNMPQSNSNPNPNPSRPSNFPDTAGLSNNVAAAYAGASNTSGPSSLPVYPPAPAPAPAPPLPPVNRRIFPAQTPPPLYPTPPPARSTPAVYPAPTPSPHYLFPPPSHGTGPIMLNFQQTQASDPSTGMSSGPATAFGASAIAQTGAYNGNAASSSLIHDQSLNPAGADDQNELSAMVAMYTNPNPNPNPNPPMAPQHVGDGPNEAAMATLYNTNYNAAASLAAPPQHVGGHDAAAYAALEAELNSNDDDFSNLGTGSDKAMAAPDQVLGMASYMNELTTMAGGGAFGGGNGNDVAASSAAAPNGGTHVVAPGAMLGEDDIFESLRGPLVDPGAAMDGNASFESGMFPDTGDGFTFSLEDFLGPLDDSQLNDGGAWATSGINTATDVAGTSLSGGNFMFPRDDDDMNQGRE